MESSLESEESFQGRSKQAVEAVEDWRCSEEESSKEQLANSKKEITGKRNLQVPRAKNLM